jgi:RNA polymerase sigma factor (sigma-70 family)
MLFVKRLNEKKLLNALQEGKEEAFVQLYSDNYTTIRNFVMRNNGKPEDAEDLLQDAIIVLWQNIQNNRFELNAKLSTYIFAIIKRMWWKKLGKNSKISYNDDLIQQLQLADETEVDVEQKKIATQLLQQLDESCRELLSRFYFLDQSTQLIATEMGFANTDVVKSKKYQCFKKLQQETLKLYSKSDFWD